MNTKKCLICGEEYDNHSQHIKYRHQLTGKEYYDKCLKTEEDGKCLECGGETKFRIIGAGYQKYCSRECMLKHRPQNIKNAVLEKYGVENILDSPEIQEKIKNTMIENYGVDSPFKSGKIQLKVQKSNKTESENKIYSELIKMFPEVKRQYKSKEYPFFCDFYIPSLDLYIEYNGFFTHNTHPFDKNNIDDIKEAKELYQKGLEKGLYMSAYKVWTQSDQHRVETARKNKIKLLVFYSMKEVENWIKERKEQKDG